MIRSIYLMELAGGSDLLIAGRVVVRVVIQLTSLDETGLGLSRDLAK